MSEPRKPIPFVIYDADGRIDMDLSCLKCGYNLRGLRDDGDCPECGASITGGWLFQCDRAWLRRVARSTIWIGIAMVCLTGCRAGRLYYITDERSLLRFVMLVVLPGALVAAGVAIVGLCGFWAFTSPRDHSDKRWCIRRVARVMLMIGLIGTLIVAISEMTCFFFYYSQLPHLPIRLAPHALCQFNNFASVGASACLGVGLWAILTYASTLAAKIPAPRLVWQSRFVARGFALCAALSCVFPIFDPR